VTGLKKLFKATSRLFELEEELFLVLIQLLKPLRILGEIQVKVD